MLNDKNANLSILNKQSQIETQKKKKQSLASEVTRPETRQDRFAHISRARFCFFIRTDQRVELNANQRSKLNFLKKKKND